MIAALMHWLVPWEFSWFFLITFLLVAVLYVRGCRRRVSAWRQFSFWAGMALIYGSLHTYFDYYAEHEFFMHRIQQVLLHHLAPLLLMAAYPGSVLRSALPLRWRIGLCNIMRRAPLRGAAAVLGNPAVATALFVLFILIWLVPYFQTLAMLDWRVYRFMNWSMVASGLIYWWLVLDHRPHPPGRMTPGLRVLSPAITMTPQIVAGAVVAFTKTDLYPIFEICGRAFTFDVLTGQMIGGLILWIPAATIEAAGAMLALQQWLRISQRERRGYQRRERLAAAARTAANG